MFISGLEKMSLVDYEGHICATVFTSGCNFRCPFCQNSDLVFCKNLIKIDEKEFFDYLEKRKNVIDSVCVSGGEPTLQKDLKDFIKKVKGRGFLVKLDTNGSNFEILKELVEEKLVDYVAIDVKNSVEKYPHTIGVNFNMENIKKSIEFLKQDFVDYEFRTTLVYKEHTKESIEEIGKWLKGSKRLFLQCFVDSGNCIQSGLKRIEKAQAEEFKEILSGYIKKVSLRGY